MSQGWLETFGVPQSPDEIVQLYNANAKIYDDHMNKQSYTAYVRAAEVLKKLKSDTTSRILDLCAGTGLVGLALYNHGFRHIHGHDGSGEMIKIAASRNVYEKLYEELLHVDRETKFLPQNYFDAVITCGSLLPGHLTVDHIPMMTTLIKDDGIVVILTR